MHHWVIISNIAQDSPLQPQKIAVDPSFNVNVKAQALAPFGHYRMILKMLKTTHNTPFFKKGKLMCSHTPVHL